MSDPATTVAPEASETAQSLDQTQSLDGSAAMDDTARSSLDQTQSIDGSAVAEEINGSSLDQSKTADASATAEESNGGSLDHSQSTGDSAATEEPVKNSQEPAPPVPEKLRCKIALVQSDITQLSVDAIVNAANSELAPGAGVCGAIFRAAGRELYNECKALDGCATGDAVLTQAHSIKQIKGIIHAVGPMVFGKLTDEDRQLLASCYQRSLDICKKHKLSSIAFPCISTGIYGFPNGAAAETVLKAVREWLQDDDNDQKLDAVVFCVFLDKDLHLYRELIPKFFVNYVDTTVKVKQAEKQDQEEHAEDQQASDDEPMDTEDSGMSRNNFDLSKFSDDREEIELNQCRVDAIPDLSRFTKLELLGFRNNLLTSINDNITHATITELDLYENQITEIRGLDALVNLEILDVSYNRLRKIQGLTNLVKLKRIYLVHNKIEKIEGLDALVNLELLELGDNRIKTIENLDNQHNLRELYLGKNKIRKLDNISHLSKLRVLNIPGNRITKLENLDTLVDLEELHVAEQGIETFDGIQKLDKLKLIDAAKNSIASLDHLDHLQLLEDLWLNENKISQWPEVDKLAKLAKLETVYLEGNPIQTQDRSSYRRKVILALEQVIQVDATPCR